MSSAVLQPPRGRWRLRRWLGTSAAPSAELDLADSRVIQDPIPALMRLRRIGSVHWLPHHSAWLVLGYAEVQRVISDTTHFAVPVEMAGDVLLAGADPVAHRAARRLLGCRLSADRVEVIGDETRLLAAESLRQRRTREVDVVDDLARPLAGHAAGRLLGLERSAIAGLPVGADALLGSAPRPTPDPVQALFEAASAALARVPGGVPMVADLRRDGSLSLAQAGSLTRAFWVAATATTVLGLPSAVLLLLAHPQLEQRLRADPELIAPFVYEALRLHPPVTTVTRKARVRSELGGVDIPAGSDVFACLTAANRDRARFDHPDEVLLDRPTHVAFGHGNHACPGARLGRKVIEGALTALLGETLALKPARPLAGVRWLEAYQAPGLHGLEHLWIAPDRTSA